MFGNLNKITKHEQGGINHGIKVRKTKMCQKDWCRGVGEKKVQCSSCRPSQGCHTGVHPWCFWRTKLVRNMVNIFVSEGTRFLLGTKQWYRWCGGHECDSRDCRRE